MPVFNAMLPKDQNIMGIQYQFPDVSLAHRGVFTFTILHCGRLINQFVDLGFKHIAETLPIFTSEGLGISKVLFLDRLSFFMKE